MFKKLKLNGITLEEFKDIFNVKKKDGETENDSLFRTAKEQKGTKFEIEREEVNGKKTGNFKKVTKSK